VHPVRLYVMDRLLRFDLLPGHPVGTTHNLVFHGTGYRDGLELVYCKSAYLDEPPSHCAMLVRSGRIVPKVFSPGLLLVVCESVRERLRGFANIAFVEVGFEKLVDIAINKMDFALERAWIDDALRSREEFFSRYDDVAAFHESIGKYFEVVMPHYETQITNQYPGQMGLVMKYSMVSPERTEKPMMRNVALPMLEEYPLFRTHGRIFMLPDVFAILDTYLDRDYYRVASATSSD